MTGLVSSGLIYLNEDFEGGNFFFAFENQSIQVGNNKQIMNNSICTVKS